MRIKLGLLLLMLLPAVGIFSVTADSCSASPIKVTDVSGKVTSTVEVIGIVGTSVKLRRADGSIVELPLTTFDRDSLIKILVEVGRGDAPDSKTNKPVITDTVDMKFKKIPAGTFLMGSERSEPYRKDREFQHKVTISKAFLMQTTVVTQGQWKAVMRTEPWNDQEFSKYVKDGRIKEGANYPASCVSWEGAVAYCKKLSEKEGKTYRLPTEAEWEYACRAGTKTMWSFGNNKKALGDYAWGGKNVEFENYAHQVGLKKPNAFGLYDMHGNVYEWCHDYFGERYYYRSPEKDPMGPASASERVFRGGYYSYSSTEYTRSASRMGISALTRVMNLGFRVACELD